MPTASSGLRDPNLRDEVAPECLKKFGEIVDSCLCNDGIERPAMSDLVWALEFALQLWRLRRGTPRSSVGMRCIWVGLESNQTDHNRRHPQ